jgi:hypothetical protein
MSQFEKYYINGKEITQIEAEKHLNKYQQHIIFKNIAHGWSGNAEYNTDIGIVTVYIPKM